MKRALNNILSTIVIHVALTSLCSSLQAQTVINGTTITTNAVYYVGNTTAGNTLTITNEGKLFITNNSFGISLVIGNTTASSNNVALITGANSLWTNRSELYVGFYGASNQMIVSNGGTVVNDYGIIGHISSSSNNVVQVIGANSLLTNTGVLIVGNIGAGNQMIVSNGGTVFNQSVRIGDNSFSSNNVVQVTGANSLWTNLYDLFVGNAGTDNQVIISNGGTVINFIGRIGAAFFSSNNLVLVTGANSLWTNRGGLYVGDSGMNNRMIVSNSGTVMATNLIMGFDAYSTSNLITMSGGASQLVVTNAAGTSTFDIRRGTNIQNGGTVRTDNLLVTNTLGAYQLNGGTSYVGQATISNGATFQIGNGTDTAYFRQTQAGVTNTFANGIQINAGGTLSFAGTITNMVTFNGGTLKGSGTLTTDLTIGAGAVIAPGNSPGTLGGASQTWASGGTYEWEINDFTGTAGADPGWDLINLSGALNITASAGNEFTIDLISLDTFNNAGNAANFDYTQDYSLIIASAAGGITGFSANAFTLNTAGFSNPTSGGLWSIAQSGNNLLLNYTAPSPVPEPSTWAMIFAGGIALAIAAYRRKKTTEMTVS